MNSDSFILLSIVIFGATTFVHGKENATLLEPNKTAEPMNSLQLDKFGNRTKREEQIWTYAPCGPLGDPPNGRYLYIQSSSSQPYSLGTTVYLMCDWGYTLYGSISSTCLNMDYQPMLGECKDASLMAQRTAMCPTITLPTNGTITYKNALATNYTTGTIATLTCDPSNYVSGSPTSTCVSGIWTPIIGTCTFSSGMEMFCANPTVLNGQIAYSHGNSTDISRPPLTTATLTCSNGYELTGPSESTCINGTFTPTLGVCSFYFGNGKNSTCITPFVQNGKMTFDQGDPNDVTRKAGTTATLTCNRGFTLRGPSQSKCFSREFTIGKCDIGYGRPTCPTPIVSNGKILFDGGNLNDTVRPFDTEATIICNDGYTRTGAYFAKCQNGNFTPPLGTCTPYNEVVETCDTPFVINGHLTFSQGNFYDMTRPTNTTVTLTCNSGYTLIGESQSTCTNKVFTPTLGSCLFGFGNGTECPKPTVSNGEIIYSQGNKSDVTVPSSTTMRLECSESYYVTGATNATCISGEITPPIGNCVYRKKEKNSLGFSRLTLTCDNGYTLNGPPASTCSGATGGFVDPPLGNCTFELGNGAYCSTPFVFRGSLEFSRGNYFDLIREPGTIATLWCYGGHVLDGPSESTCISGTFTPPLGTCNFVSGTCATPTVSNGTITYNQGNYSDFHHPPGTTAILVCKSGYILSGNSESTCIDGVYTPAFGTCVYDGSCLSLSNTRQQISYSHGSHSDVYRPALSTATLTCSSGYYVEGASVSTCITGEFLPKLGYCQTGPILDCYTPVIANGKLSFNVGGINDNSRFTRGSSKCYFSEIRKNLLETRERPEKSTVSTSCTSGTVPLETLLGENLTGVVKNENPLAVLLCRGAAMCDLDFNNPSVLNEWKKKEICNHHINELLRQWDKNVFRDNHVYRTKTSTHGNVDACSMPDGVGPSHASGRPASRSHLSLKGADAILKQEHILAHPGIPVCKTHAKYANDLTMSLSSPPAKKAKESTSSSDESDTCPNDPPYQPPREKKNKTELVDSFYSFAKVAGQTRVCTSDSWSEMKSDTRARKIRTAKNLFHTMLGIMVPEGTEDFKHMVQRKTFLSEEWTSGSSKNYENVMKQVAHQFFAAENRRSKLIVLSLVATSTSYLEVVKYIPNLSRYMYQSAKLFGKRKRMNVEVTKKLERYNPEPVRAFIEFITSPTVLIGLPYGTRKVKFSDGHKEEIPNSIRQQSSSEIIEMWTKLCKDNGQTDLLLSPSTMYKILQVCTATKRESTTCVDYFIAHGMEAFDELLRIIEVWKNEELLDHHSLKQLRTEVSETEQYYRVDFRLHIKNISRVANHCANYALSDPKNEKLALSCSSIPEKHSHDLLCDRCERANATLVKFKEYAEEFHTESEKLVAISQGNSKQIAKESQSRRKEELELVKQSMTYISEMKNHLLRAAFTNQEREKIISSLKDNEALATLDFAQKFLPKFHREKQSQYFGKKGISYHVTHIAAKINDNLAQHSFVHIYSGSVTQDSTLVVLTISHFLQQLEKVGIRKIFLRSDNAGCYHSAATIGSLHWLNQTTGVDIDSWSFSEAQNGKSSSDRDANRVKHKAKNYVDKGNDIPSSDEFFTALKENPLNGVSVFHGSVTPDSDSGKTEWTGISTLNHFTLEKNGLTGRRYKSVGNGIFVEKAVLKPIKGSFKFDDEAGFLASSIKSKLDERKAFLSGEETKFWYHPHCAKTSSCVKESDVVTESIEEDVPATEIGDLYACPEPGCSSVFLMHQNLEKHLLRGKHKIAPERVTQRDYSVNLFRRYLEDVNESKTFPTMEAALKELKETKEVCGIEQGWALPEKRKRKVFDEDVRKFLVECFDEGLNSKSILSPFSINKRMRSAKNSAGNKRFAADQILTVPQIAGFMSREAEKRKSSKVSQQTVTHCTRRRRASRKLHRHRRRRNNHCENKAVTKEVEHVVPEEEHEDAEWIAFMESEEFWTLSEEFYSATIRPLGTIGILTCDDGYFLVGESKSTCNNGGFYPYFGQCLIGTIETPCPTPDVDRHYLTFSQGSYYDKTRPPGTKATLTCPPNHIVNGTDGFQDAAVCTNGLFIPKLGACVRSRPTCGAIQNIEGIQLKYSNGESTGPFPEGTNVTALCINGQSLTGVSSSECRDGIWHPYIWGKCLESDLPCSPIIRPFGEVAHYDDSNLNYAVLLSVKAGMGARIMCMNGTELGRTSCLNGQWTPAITAIC